MPRKKGVEKQPTVIRLTPDAKLMLEVLAADSGLSLAGYTETFIRREFERKRLMLPPKEQAQ